MENSTKAGKKWNDHIDLHFGEMSQKVTVTVTVVWGGSRSATRTRAKQQVTATEL